MTDVDVEHAKQATDVTQDPKSGLSYRPRIAVVVAALLGPVSVYDGFWIAQKQGSQWKPFIL
jgi:hypothetical protein